MIDSPKDQPHSLSPLAQDGLGRATDAQAVAIMEGLRVKKSDQSRVKEIAENPSRLFQESNRSPMGAE